MKNGRRMRCLFIGRYAPCSTPKPATAKPTAMTLTTATLNAFNMVKLQSIKKTLFKMQDAPLKGARELYQLDQKYERKNDNPFIFS